MLLKKPQSNYKISLTARNRRKPKMTQILQRCTNSYTNRNVICKLYKNN